MKKVKLGLLALLFTSSFFFIYINHAHAQIGQIWETIVGNPDLPQDPGTNPNTGNLPPSDQLTCGDGADGVDIYLRREFGVVVVSGGSWPSWAYISGEFVPSAVRAGPVNCDIKKNIYGVMRRLSNSSNFIRVFKSDGIVNVRCYIVSTYQGNMGVVEEDGDNIHYLNCPLITPSSFYIFLHEMGHIIHRRNGRLLQLFDNNQLARLDPGCYDVRNGGYVLKSYALTPTYPKNESFGEAIALYYYNSSSSTYLYAQPIANFKQNCSNTYRWMRNNVYQYEFN